MTITCGLLIFRRTNKDLEVMIVHPGGPFFTKRDNGVCSIPKGVPDHGESFEEAAIREFGEETGHKVNIKNEDLITLGTIKYNNKTMYCYAYEMDIGDIEVKSNSFDLEWPPKSGKMQSFPEIDRGGYFEIEDARIKLYPQQGVFLNKLKEILDI